MATLYPFRIFTAFCLVVLLMPRPAVQAQDAADGAYWIFFHDKPEAAGKLIMPAPDHLTERARQRRRRRGRPSPPALDAPVSPVYLEALARRGITPRVESRWLNAVSARLDGAQLDYVRSQPFVRAVRPVAYGERAQAPDVLSIATIQSTSAKKTLLDYGASRAQLEFINAVEPLERGINGTGVLVGFLDTEYGGFTHPALSHLREDGRLLADSNFVGVSQTDRHGRLVASIAVGFAEGHLIGPGHGATVLAATTEFVPSETNAEEDNLVRALEWMEAQGVDVVNISLGYNTFDAGERSYTKEDLDGDTGVTTRAVDVAAALGVVVVAAAGNEAGNGWDLVLTPADADSVITAGAAASRTTRAGFSSMGPTADGRIKPDVSVLGVGVVNASSSTGYGSTNGTSVAAPLVSGVVAQILQVNPDLNPIDVRTLLRSTASQAANPDNELGWGIIDADAAVRLAAVTSTRTEAGASPTPAFEVHPPYPNPFTHETVLEVRAPAKASRVRLSLYNALGQEVRVPFEGTLRPGTNRLVLRAGDLPAGFYLYRLHGEGIAHTGPLMVVR